MNVEIRELDESYKGKKFLFQYETTHYFDIEATEKEEEWGLRFIGDYVLLRSLLRKLYKSSLNQCF